VDVPPGGRQRVNIPVAQAYGQAEVSLPVVVINGRRPGPRLFVSAAVHGDEINGVEIVRRLLNMPVVQKLNGALIAAPIVNVYGFLNQNRYLPDRRDLNRSFPGSQRGSLASRLADVFMREIVTNSTHGIDLHTASHHRVNLPQIRACLDDPEAERLARAFGVAVILNANLRDGSLRQAVVEHGIPMLLYEGGEALRFDEMAIRAGVRGVLRVMRALGMLRARAARSRVDPMIARSSHWVRAPDSGILRSSTRLGARVSRGSVLGIISDPVGDHESKVSASASGIVIARSDLPLVNEGDALFHVASFEATAAAASEVELQQAELDPDGAAAPSGEDPIR
jgi:predicted deacylase